MSRIANYVRYINTFNPHKLSFRDWLSVKVYNDNARAYPTPALIKLPSSGSPSNLFFLGVHPRYVAPNISFSGFLYYHVPYPSYFLSGGLRFRCSSSRNPDNFNAGYDLDDRMGLAWTLPLARIIARPKLVFVLHQLVWEGLLSESQLRLAKTLLRDNPERVDNSKSPAAFVHTVGQPFTLDLTAPLRVAVTGPHAVITASNVYPAVAARGGAIVRFERVEGREELRLRVVMPVPDYHDRSYSSYGDQRRLPDPVCEDFLPQFRGHFPPLRAGDLLPDPYAAARGEFVWTYTNDADPARDAALYCLLQPHPHPYVAPPKPEPAPLYSTTTFSTTMSELSDSLAEITAEPEKSGAESPSDTNAAPDDKPPTSTKDEDKTPQRGTGTGWGLPPELVPPPPEEEWVPPPRAKGWAGGKMNAKGGPKAKWQHWEKRGEGRGAGKGNMNKGPPEGEWVPSPRANEWVGGKMNAKGQHKMPWEGRGAGKGKMKGARKG
ncbi:hypothetical protein C8R45DRAFT_1076385 [Mycena sanguinolenta]|nr:hypothetical protein C8R45DRAFT_1076385 [Mycena sanguinolenta]